MIPNFLVIANKRCGTSWLNTNLAEHPEIFMPEQKGVHFFDLHYEKGVSFYEDFFKGAKKEKRLGETEHSYFWDDNAPERILSTLGKIPLILSLRQPVERAYSHFQVRRRHMNRGELSFDFEKVFMQGLKDNVAEITWGLYGEQLRKYLQHFPLETFHIIKFEDIMDHPRETIQEAYRFLGVDSGFVPEHLNKKWTPSTNIPAGTGPLKAQFLYTSAFATLVRKVLKKTCVKDIKIYRKYSPQPLDIAVKKKLTKHFDSDIKLLSDLTGIDLSSWMSSSM